MPAAPAPTSPAATGKTSTVGAKKPAAGASTPAAAKTPSVTPTPTPSPSTSKKPTSTKQKAKVTHSTTITTGSTHTVIPLITHDAPSKKVPTGAIVAAVVGSLIVVAAVLFQIYRWRSRRAARATTRAVPPPPPRSAAFVQSLYGSPSTGTAGAGKRNTMMSMSGKGGGDAKFMAAGSAAGVGASSDDEYEKSPLTPPNMRAVGADRPASWVTFNDGSKTSSSVNMLSSSATNSSANIPMLEYAHPAHANSGTDPFASDSESNPAQHLQAQRRLHTPSPRPHTDGTPGTPVSEQDEHVGQVVDDPVAVAAVMRYSFGDDAAYNSAQLPAARSGEMMPGVSEDGTPLPPRQARSPPPHMMPSSNSSGSSSSHSHSPAPDQPQQYSTRRQSSYGNGRPTSRLYSTYIPNAPSPLPAGTIRGAPHLPHVRAGVEIVLPTPLAPQAMYGVPIAPSTSVGSTRSRPVSRSHTPAAQEYERTVRRSASRTSITSAADVVLSARHAPSRPASAAGSDVEGEDGTASRRGRGSIKNVNKEKRRSVNGSRTRGRSTSAKPVGPGSGVGSGEREEELTAPRRPWNGEKGDSGSGSERESVASASSAPSSWRNSGHPV